ncbi:hypothetical protein N7476_004955 [Penicillium atrosanguineum]|uniref:DEP domain-containing protein n=1 Tax=Penicillium atrosanguineum TaxID=1132637 RepID=A0A9W9U5P3_9EURO|nr:hypothetical protein N7526_001946 [Penicillium atrosanguineum]KAJ5318535.1 hypothetical protein N7476_004955 [Penicillium atrosanguineum]
MNQVQQLFNRFANAGLIKHINYGGSLNFPFKGKIFQLAPKGINILRWFRHREVLKGRAIDCLMSSYKSFLLIQLERDLETDKILHSKPFVEAMFTLFARQYEVESDAAICLSSRHETTDQLQNFAIRNQKLKSSESYFHMFKGERLLKWVMNFSTVVDLQEACFVANFFIIYDLIMMVRNSRTDNGGNYAGLYTFQHTIYGITDRGSWVCDRIS